MTSLHFNQIFHPSDFSESSRIAFAHALRLALAAQSGLTIFHTDPERRGPNWNEFPRVRQTLERWGILPLNSSEEEVGRLGLQVNKVTKPHKDTVDSILRYLNRHPHDLIVLVTYQHDGLERLLNKAVAEPVARRSGEMTLFIPIGATGFVSLENGKTELRNILIPVDRAPSPQEAVETASALAHLLGCIGVNFTLLFVGNLEETPRVRLPFGESGRWIAVIKQGNVVDQIIQTADEISADLIVMATQGQTGFLDALRGNTTDRIIRASKCPLLTVPPRIKDNRTTLEAFVLEPTG